jgi:hypothetical protein
LEIKGVSMSIENNISHIVREYAMLSRLYDIQPALTQHFLDQQAAMIISALEQDGRRIRFQFPDRVILEGGEILDLPAAIRGRTVGSILQHFSRLEKRAQLVQHLNSLEHGFNPGLAVCGKLIRYTLARTMVYALLPDGHPVHYRFESSEEIPFIPEDKAQLSAMLAATDVVTVLERTKLDEGRLQVPYVAAAQRFYMPQWVAFGDDDRLLTGSLAEARACVASLVNAVRILQESEAICPSIVADEAYQRKRAGLLGQLVNQGRALARYETHEMIARIKQRASEGSLNRGLSLDISYFDDEAMALKSHMLEIIPAGRIMFVPAFVVLAVQKEYIRINQDTRLNASTRKHMFSLLATLEKAFRNLKESQLL